MGTRGMDNKQKSNRDKNPSHTIIPTFQPCPSEREKNNQLVKCTFQPIRTSSTIPGPAASLRPADRKLIVDEKLLFIILLKKIEFIHLTFNKIQYNVRN